MKLGDVLKKERDNRGLSAEEIAQHLGIAPDEYQQMESGESPIETWGPTIAQIAIELETPTSRLFAESGRFADTKEGQAGPLIQGHRERREKQVSVMADALELPEDEYRTIEAGESPLEKYGPLFLGFAEAIEQPVFNLFYPCGLPFQELDDYP